MPEQNQPGSAAQSHKKSQPKTKPVVVTKSAGALAGGLAEFRAGPIGAAGFTPIAPTCAGLTIAGTTSGSGSTLSG
jgi:hypothetical protein